MSKTLIIIEAPNKREKLSKILGAEYNIQASVGHIMDLDPSCMSINLETFEPSYIICKDKHEVKNKLLRERDKCDNVIIATDGDSEGCAIAWSIAQVLGIENPKRMIFNEITEKAINKALNNLVDIDINLFHSQQARRMLDRIIGYIISPILWKAMQGSKSAGRVQSVVTRLICEKEAEITEFFEGENMGNSYFKTNCVFNKSHKGFLCENKKTDYAKIENKQETLTVLNNIITSKFTTNTISEKKSTRQPSPPFTTDSLIQAAHQKLGFTTQRTTQTAQKLYAAGYITYIRTDSPNISETAILEIGKFVVKNFGENYHREQQYESKSKNTQGAHECIRPTHVKNITIDDKQGITNDEISLYELIWKRTVASQMQAAIFNISILDVNISDDKKYKFVIEHEKCIFDGFLKLYGEANEENINLPKVGELLNISNVISTEEYKKPPTRYDDASIVGKMKKIGIGRPSTYNSIVKKIQDSNYVCVKNNDGIEKNCSVLSIVNNTIEEKTKKIQLGKDANKCTPTEMGKVVTKFLLEHFPKIMDYKFTSDMEDMLDKIEEGTLDHKVMLKNFYGEFQGEISKLKDLLEDSESMAKLKNLQQIGVHPVLGHKLFTCVAKFGPIVQMFNSENKLINTAPIKEPLTLNNITIEDAVQLLKFPILLGKYERKNVKLMKGQFGYYLKIGDQNVGLKISDEEANNFTIEQAIAKIVENNSKFLWKRCDEKYNYCILNGPHGKFINITTKKKTRSKGKNISFPEDIDINTLTFDKLMEIITKASKRGRKSKPKNTGK